MSGEPVHRKHLASHDYKERCIYHVTLVCSDRAQVLGRIVGDTIEEARCELTPLGVAVSHCIDGISYYGRRHGRDLQILAKVVMPDHVHFILFVRQWMDCSLGEVIRGFKMGCNRALRNAIGWQKECVRTDCDSGSGASGVQQNCSGGSPLMGVGLSNQHALHNVSNQHALHKLSNQPTPHGSYNPNEAVYQQNRGYCQQPLPVRSERMLQKGALFADGYDETRLRRCGQLSAMIAYVRNNPKHRWLRQRYPDRLLPIRNIRIGERNYDGIGNVMLLGLLRWQVHVRSRWTDDVRREYMNQCVLKSREGCVMVSPFISPYEAAVRNVCLQENRPVIVLSGHGLSDVAQCPGNLFEWCVRGLVLLLVPSDCPREVRGRGISRAECVMLNGCAEDICNE